MDLNHLLFGHQLSLMRADAARSPRARCLLVRTTRGYAARIGELQRALGVSSPIIRGA